VVLGHEVPMALGLWTRLLGLAFLRLDCASPGLLIPRCASVHTFGMRFALDVVFLDRSGRALREVRGVPPWRVVTCRGADAVLETPASRAQPRLTDRERGMPNSSPRNGGSMSLIDKLTGRTKKAAGDLAGDSSLRREGRREEKKGEAKEKLDRAEDAVEDKASEVADLERKT
jgi:uncharacterized protein YjbJ (UPF0337 family)